MITEDKLVDLVSGCIETDALGRQSIHVSKLSKECYELSKQMSIDFAKYLGKENYDPSLSYNFSKLFELYLKSKDI